MLKNRSKSFRVGRNGDIFEFFGLNEGGYITGVIEAYIPNFHRISVIHDDWLDYLNPNDNTWIDLATNVPTMLPAFVWALLQNIGDSIDNFTFGE